MRLGLAVLSITIGVASVIVLVGIGRGAEQEVRSTIERMGKNLIVVSAGRSRVIKGQLGEIGMKKTLTLRDATAIAKECPSVRRVAPAYAKKLPVRFEDMTHSTKIVGTVPSIRNVRNLALQSGSLFDDAENRLMAPVAVLGPTVVESLFGGRHPVGSSILIGKVSFKVIGVTRPKGAVSGEDQDDQGTGSSANGNEKIGKCNVPQPRLRRGQRIRRHVFRRGRNQDALEGTASIARRP